MEIAPELPDFVLAPVDIKVLEREGFCSVLLPNGALVEGSTSHLMAVLHELIYRDVERSEPNAVFIHGATVSIGDKKVLLVGHKGCGKTTLTLHLVAAGYTVDGDEHLLVRSHDVIARPRTLRVKPGTLALVPALNIQTMNAPFVRNWDGTPIRALSPAIGGKPWVIRPGRLDAIVFLTANHGGRSVIGSVSTDQAFRRLMTEVVRWPANIVLAAARLRTLLIETSACEMFVGDLVGAERQLKRLMAS
jgi:hypothetical protein